jgi:prepilin-type N-terminal cleavage/methylation domain-containing protein
MRGASRGFTLLEVVLALAIMAVGLIATAPLFVLAARENAGGGDLGTVGSLAVERLEQLRGLHFYSLANGGSLDSNVAGYSDTSNPDFDVRWVIADSPSPPAGMKVIVVRALARYDVIGRPKEVTMVTVRGE